MHASFVQNGASPVLSRVAGPGNHPTAWGLFLCMPVPVTLALPGREDYNIKIHDRVAKVETTLDGVESRLLDIKKEVGSVKS